MPDRLQMYNLPRRLGAQTVLTREFLGRVDQDGPARQQREVWALTKAAPGNKIDRTLAFDWRATLAQSDLPKVCGTTQWVGVGVGFAFLDDALLDFSMHLPGHYKLKGLKLRWFFKEALRRFLPDKIITKDKQGFGLPFGLPFGMWPTRHRAAKALAVDSQRSPSTRGIVQPPLITELIEQYLPSHPGYCGELVWELMTLEQGMQLSAPNCNLKG